MIRQVNNKKNLKTKYLIQKNKKTKGNTRKIENKN